MSNELVYQYSLDDYKKWTNRDTGFGRMVCISFHIKWSPLNRSCFHSLDRPIVPNVLFYNQKDIPPIVSNTTIFAHATSAGAVSTSLHK